MHEGNHCDLGPGRQPVSLCLLALVAVLAGSGGPTTAGQERKAGPKIIVLEEVQVPHAARPRRFAPPPEKPVPRAEPVLDLTPPRFKASGAAAVPSPLPHSDTGHAVSQVNAPVGDVTFEQPRAESGSIRRSRLGEQASASVPKATSVGSGRPSGGTLGDSLQTPQAPGLLPLAPLRESSVAGSAGGPPAGHRPTVAETADVRTTSFASSAIGEPSASPQMLSSDASTTAELPQTTNHAAGAAPWTWPIAGLWVAISFSLALSLLACGLVLLAVRQASGKHGSILRVELTQAGGGSLVVPWTVPAVSMDRRESPARCHTSVADLGDSSLAATMLGPQFGKPSREGGAARSEQEDTILQQIIEENLALQKGN